MKYSEVYILKRIDWGSSSVFSNIAECTGVLVWGLCEGAGFGDGRGDSSWILINIM